MTISITTRIAISMTDLLSNDLPRNTRIDPVMSCDAKSCALPFFQAVTGWKSLARINCTLLAVITVTLVAILVSAIARVGSVNEALIFYKYIRQQWTE
jgi:hypothetical protein